MKTGFDAYWIYISTKIHFESNYDISERGFPNKTKLLNKWNSERVDRDGKLFAEVHNTIQKKKDLLYLFATYYFVNGKTYVKDIIEDDYQTYYRMMNDLNNIENIFIDDVLTVIEFCQNNKITIKDLFTKKASKVFDIKISLLSLVIFNIIFKFTSKIDTQKINTLSRKIIEEKIKRLDKFQKIVYNDLSKVDWVTKFKMTLGTKP